MSTNRRFFDISGPGIHRPCQAVTSFRAVSALLMSLAEAFSGAEPPVEMVSPLGREMMDRAGELDRLKGVRWQDATQEDLQALASLIPAMTIEAFRCHTPAFLRAALKAPESEAATSIFYALAPLDNFDAFLAGTAALFTPAQAGVIADCLEALAADESVEMLAEEAAPAVALWRRRAAQGA
jgi:hypothetical protein